jgi:hypothetical protein
VWLSQNVLPGRRSDVDDVVAALTKVQQHAEDLREVAVP